MSDRFARGERVSLVGVMGNLGLSGVKLLLGMLSGSTAVIADSLHSFSDVMVSTITYLGVRLSRKPPDQTHPYGHYDAEAIAGLVVSIALILLSFEFMMYAGESLLAPRQEVKSTALIAFFVTLVVKEPMARYTIKAGREINSPAVVADGQHHRSDVYSSFAVFVGVLGSIFGFQFLDPLAGVAVALLVLKLGFEVGWQNVRALMGTVPSQDYVEDVRREAMAVEGVECVHNIMVYTIGAFTKLNLHVCVAEDMPLKEAHSTAHRVQRRLVDTMPEVITALVHVEPFDSHHRINHL